MFIKSRRPESGCSGRFRQPDRYAKPLIARVVDHHAAVQSVGVGKGFWNRVDGSGWNAVLHQHVAQWRLFPIFQNDFNLFAQLLTMREPGGVGGEIGVISQAGLVDAPTKSLELRIVQNTVPNLIS